jgi:hypothetical protein
MKSTALRARRSGTNTESYSLTKAKADLARLLAKSEAGVTVYIVKGHKRFLVQPVPEIEPIPMRPAGYFEFDEEDIKLDRKFSTANVVPQPDAE